jgi:hypothetical protein
MDIGVVPREAGRHNFHNRIVLVNQLQVPPDRRWIRIEMQLPKRQLRNHDGLGILPSGGSDGISIRSNSASTPNWMPALDVNWVESTADPHPSW